MIAIAAESGSLIKKIPVEAGVVYGFHRIFGFITEAALESRLRMRKSRGLLGNDNAWLCRFQIESGKANGWSVKALEGCEAKQVSNQSWKLSSVFGSFQLLPAASLDQKRIATLTEASDSSIKKSFGVALALVLIMFLLPKPKQEEVIAPIPEPVTVKVVTEVQKQVVVPTNGLPKIVAEQSKQARRAVEQNLGFLGLLGRKDLTKALGGVPTKLKDASPGAGPGGNAGSGGELLVGLGQGVKHTTVGNTGVSGLGGVGTKGAGGGAGGYGDRMVGSGEGKGVSAMPISQDVVLEGGLDRSVIQATIAKYISQVRACYEEGLRTNPGLLGQIMMNFEINGAGDLNFAKVAKSSLGNAQVEQCVAGKMMSWKFPKPRGGVNVKVNYPFLLRPVSS